ncbi:hypothetical protein EVAR_9240_1 [Eumeta japonica]|uniref:Uncharacterized protein n=1 Tax=Eumeta variegata TaxID=151549 RepID=A0A4C1TLI8_EUMVA|nr:hypothetical protein EVAR_9240_1 [Eumeta japonica]
MSPEPQAGLSQEEAMDIEEKIESSNSDYEYDLKAPEMFNQTDLNDLIRDLGMNEFVWLVHNFLGNKKSMDFSHHVEELMCQFQKLGCNISIKLHFLHNHLDYFPSNLGDLSEEQGERFHQDLRTMEERYQGHWNAHMMADYCWSIQNSPQPSASVRKSTKRKFFLT